MAVLTPTAFAAGLAKPFDFNGDGYADLAIGSPYGKVGTKKAAGFVTVTYGSKSGLNTGKRQVLSQDTKGVTGTAEANDHFGHAVASADFDHDGYADLAVGAPDEDSGAKKNVGAVTVFWGGRSGLGTNAVTALPDPTVPAGMRAGLELGASGANRLGHAYFVWSGVYGWGSATFTPGGARAASGRPAGDLTLHTAPRPGEKPGTARAAAVPLLFKARFAFGNVTGKGESLIMSSSTEDDAQISVLDPVNDHSFKLVSSMYAAPGPLAVGDFDGDRHADIAIGQQNDYYRTGGQVTVFKGSAAGIAPAAKYTINADTAGVPGAAAKDFRFGADVSAGDVNKDGKADLAVGASGTKVGTAASAGGVYLLFGSRGGLTGAKAQWISQATAGVPGTAAKGDNLGWQVSLLDHNKDGYADLVAGAPWDNSGEGSVTLVRGRSTGFTPVSGAVWYTPKTFGISGKNAQLGYHIGR
ncbi:FG-GAP-like repeat-containing protein [Actinomadura macrotermitis]|nr:FG-GAP-like repeat-containing protein [Actinomadura macrotermitis]